VTAWGLLRTNERLWGCSGGWEGALQSLGTLTEAILTVKQESDDFGYGDRAAWMTEKASETKLEEDGLK
jgi:hypothetical protein